MAKPWLSCLSYMISQASHGIFTWRGQERDIILTSCLSSLLLDCPNQHLYYHIQECLWNSIQCTVASWNVGGHAFGLSSFILKNAKRLASQVPAPTPTLSVVPECTGCSLTQAYRVDSSDTAGLDTHTNLRGVSPWQGEVLHPSYGDPSAGIDVLPHSLGYVTMALPRSTLLS